VKRVYDCRQRAALVPAPLHTARITAVTLLLLLLLPASAIQAQSPPQLLLINTEIALQPDGFGGQRQVLLGDVFNHGREPSANIRITVAAVNADAEAIGEGIGYLVDACGSVLLDATLAPGQVQAFVAPIELYSTGAVADLELHVQAEQSPPRPSAAASSDFRRIASGEVVQLEWESEDSLIYGTGCERAVFTELDWRRYRLDFDKDARQAIEHPDAQHVSPAMLERSELTLRTQARDRDPTLYASSQLRYAPTARRALYQSDLHSLYSSEPDGSYRRLIHPELHRHSLRGYLWGRQPGVFLAYYFGAYGDPVRYFTAHVDGQMLSGWLENMPASQIVPGVAPDGYATVAGRDEGGISGYYWQGLYGAAELLFEAELPGNNYPAPLITRDAIYIVRPPATGTFPSLHCYSRSRRSLTLITTLPVSLPPATRAWTWLSPAGKRLALAANGIGGGLWWLELDAC